MNFNNRNNQMTQTQNWQNNNYGRIQSDQATQNYDPNRFDARNNQIYQNQNGRNIDGSAFSSNQNWQSNNQERLNPINSQITQNQNAINYEATKINTQNQNAINYDATKFNTNADVISKKTDNTINTINTQSPVINGGANAGNSADYGKADNVNHNSKSDLHTEANNKFDKLF